MGEKINKKQAEEAYRSSGSFVRSSVSPISRLPLSIFCAFSPRLPPSLFVSRSVNSNFFSYISKPTFSHVCITREVSRYLGWKGRAFWLFFCVQGRLPFFYFIFYFLLNLYFFHLFCLPPFTSDSSFLLCIIHHWPILQIPIIYINLLSSPGVGE